MCHKSPNWLVLVTPSTSARARETVADWTPPSMLLAERARQRTQTVTSAPFARNCRDPLDQAEISGIADHSLPKDRQSARCGSRFPLPIVASSAGPSDGGHHEQPPECCGH